MGKSIPILVTLLSSIHARYHFLLQMGLKLRPGYRHGWTPSRRNEKGGFLCKDTLQHFVRSYLAKSTFAVGDYVYLATTGDR